MAYTDDWLALTTEETLEPDLKICDPHPLSYTQLTLPTTPYE